MALFNRRRKQLEMNEQAQRYREYAPKIVDGCVENGCPEQDDYDRAVVESLDADTISISAWEKGGDMPIIKWDAAFDALLDRRIALLTNMRTQGFSWYPWHILSVLPAQFKAGPQFAFSQGSRPSCAGHAAGFAHNMSTLIEIAMGQPHIYNPINPICTWLASKRGSYSGGQNVGVMCDWTNRLGNFPITAVGSNNTTAPKNYMDFKDVAAKHQSGACLIPKDNLVERLIKACKAGFGIHYGTSVKVNGSTTDKNGMRVATLGGSWAHAMSMSSYANENGEEYVWWLNSHGPRYKAADKYNSPADGAWMNKSILAKFASGMSRYGSPVIVIPETVVAAYVSFSAIVQFKLTR